MKNITGAQGAVIVRLLIEAYQSKGQRILEAGYTGQKKDKNGHTRYYADGRQVKNPNATEKANINAAAGTSLPAGQSPSHNDAATRIDALHADTPPEHVAALANDLMKMSVEDLTKLSKGQAEEEPDQDESKEQDDFNRIVLGKTFKDKQGNEYLAHSKRHGKVTAFPIVDGKPVVNNQSAKYFAVTKLAKLQNAGNDNFDHGLTADDFKLKTPDEAPTAPATPSAMNADALALDALRLKANKKPHNAAHLTPDALLSLKAQGFVNNAGKLTDEGRAHLYLQKGKAVRKATGPVKPKAPAAAPAPEPKAPAAPAAPAAGMSADANALDALRLKSNKKTHNPAHINPEALSSLKAQGFIDDNNKLTNEGRAHLYAEKLKGAPAPTGSATATPAAPKPKWKRANRNKDSLISIVKRKGGINSKSLKTDYDYQADIIEGGLLHAVRKQGMGLDEMASTLQVEGHIIVPEGQDPGDYLLDRMKGRHHSALRNTDKEIESEAEAFYKAQHEAKQGGHDERSIEGSRRSGVQAGESAGQKEGATELDEWDNSGAGETGNGEKGTVSGDGYDSADANDYDRNAGQDGPVDTSFDFGANADEPKADEAPAPAATAAPTATLKKDPRDKTYEKLIKKGKPIHNASDDENGIHEIDRKHITPELRRLLQSEQSLQRGWDGPPEETESFQLKDKSDVTGDPLDDGMILIDKRKKNLALKQRHLDTLHAAGKNTDTEAADKKAKANADVENAIMHHLKNNYDATGTELRRAGGHKEYDENDPTSNPVHAALDRLEKSGKIKKGGGGNPLYSKADEAPAPTAPATAATAPPPPDDAVARHMQRQAFTGVDAQGRQWQNGELVAAKDDGEVMPWSKLPEPLTQAAPKPPTPSQPATGEPLTFDRDTNTHNGIKLRRGDYLTGPDGQSYRLDRDQGNMLSIDKIKNGRVVDTLGVSTDPTSKDYFPLKHTGTNYYDQSAAAPAGKAAPEPAPAPPPGDTLEKHKSNIDTMLGNEDVAGVTDYLKKLPYAEAAKAAGTHFNVAGHKTKKELLDRVAQQAPGITPSGKQKSAKDRENLAKYSKFKSLITGAENGQANIYLDIEGDQYSKENQEKIRADYKERIANAVKDLDPTDKDHQRLIEKAKSLDLLSKAPAANTDLFGNPSKATAPKGPETMPGLFGEQVPIAPDAPAAAGGEQLPGSDNPLDRAGAGKGRQDATQDMFGLFGPATKAKIDQVNNDPDPVTEPSTPAAAAAEPQPNDTPRTVAARVSAAMAGDFEKARASAVPNMGEDIKGAARHKRTPWKGLKDAEANGTAEALVKRDELLKNNPSNLSTILSPGTALGVLTSHLAMQAFPKEVHQYAKYVKSDKDMVSTPEQLREQYYEAFTEIKKLSEDLATQGKTPKEIASELKTKVSDLIDKFRKKGQGEAAGYYMTKGKTHYLDGDKYNPVANSLADMYNRLQKTNATSVLGRVNDFGKRLHATTTDGKPTVETLQTATKAIGDVLEGKSFNQAFDTVEKKGAGFDYNSAYGSAITRTGGKKIDMNEQSTTSPGAKVFMDDMKVRGVQFGNSLPDQERVYHAQKSAEALSDLTSILGLPDEAAGLGGKLGLAIGARGRQGAKAHFEPWQADDKNNPEAGGPVINLTRANGAGSLAHEWGHGLDHYAANNKTGGNRFLSDLDNGSPESNGAMGKVHEAMQSSGFNKRLREAAIAEGLSSKEFSYWNSSHEKFARTFERHVQNKLHEAGRENTYLTGLHKQGHPLWPTNDEMAHMAPHMDALIAAIAAEKFPNHKMPAPAPAAPRAAAPAPAAAPASKSTYAHPLEKAWEQRGSRKDETPYEAFQALHGRIPTMQEMHGGPGGLFEKLKGSKAFSMPNQDSTITDVTPAGYGPGGADTPPAPSKFLRMRDLKDAHRLPPDDLVKKHGWSWTGTDDKGNQWHNGRFIGEEGTYKEAVMPTNEKEQKIKLIQAIIARRGIKPPQPKPATAKKIPEASEDADPRVKRIRELMDAYC